MKQTLGGKTTVRRAGREGTGHSPTTLAIRWVFPATDGALSQLDAPRTTIGRGEQCSTRLEGDDISRLHAEVVWSDSIAIIRDCGSTNGVRVNGATVQDYRLQAGCVVRLGGWVGIAVEAPRGTVEMPPIFDEVASGVFAGPRLRSSLDVARRVAKSDLPLVVEGETGTGKERVARAVHAWSERTGPFIAINCAALPESIAEAELFGYRRGAFTGAEQASLGHFRSAEGGTILLDEISDLPMALQAKVLRVIEQREVVPLGESRPVALDVRIIAAAQNPLLASVQAGRFRADLLARLEGETIVLPPLRERREDICFLFRQLWRQHAHGDPPGLEADLVERLCLYHWPFNVRELDLLVRRMLAQHGGQGNLNCSRLPARFLSPPPSAQAGIAAPPDQPSHPKRSGPAEDSRDYLALVGQLRTHRGNLARAATAVGISRQRAYRLLQTHPELDLEDFRDGHG